MVMQALPDIARNVAEPLSKVDEITMYGEGNSAKLLQDIINGTTQITEGFAEGMGCLLYTSTAIIGEMTTPQQSRTSRSAPVWSANIVFCPTNNLPRYTAV